MKKLVLPLFLIPLGILFSCHREKGSAQETSGSDVNQAGTVTLSMEQFSSAAMKVGDPETMQFSNQVHVNGYIRPSVSGMASISSLVPGRVKEIYHSVGDRVRRGDPLFTLEGTEIIALQQEYAEVFQKLILLKADDQRYQALSEENVVAEKDFLRKRSEYNIMLARSEGLKARLRMVRLDPGEIVEGRIRPELTVVTPIDGVVSGLDLMLGQFIDPQSAVMEIVNPAVLELELKVFETDMAGLEAGQDVIFTIPGREEIQYEAVLRRIGNSIDQESKTIVCFAELKDRYQGTLVNNLFVEARVTTCQRETRVVPEQAIIREPDGDFVWVSAGQTEGRITFRRIPVVTGMTREGFTEVTDSGLTNVLLQGAYELPASD